MDWSKLENIIFAAVSAVLGVFMFVMLFLLISKGKRKTCGLDIFLRIFTSVVLVVYAVGLAFIVLSELEGGYRLAITTDGELKATLMLGTFASDLPAPQFFATLVSQTGREIVIIVFAFAFILLVADCISAKRRDKKGKGESEKSKKSKKTARSAEEIKRQAELDKIRKIGDAAVKKTSAAATADKTDTATESRSTAPTDVSEHALTAGEPIADEEQEPDWLTTPTDSADWRDGKTDSEFVGLAGLDDKDDFDTFDDIDERPTDGQTDAQTEPTDDASTDEERWYENDDTYDEEPANADLDTTDGANDIDTATDADNYVDDNDADDFDGEELFEDVDTDEPQGAAEEPEPKDETFGGVDDDEWYTLGDGPSEVLTDEYADAPTGESGTEAVTEPAESMGDVLRETDGAVEPDRDIYIPKMRTVERQVARHNAPRTETRAASERKSPAPQKRGTSTSSKPAKAKSGGKRAGRGGHDPKDLPVTRRYVILDRTSAVNIFSDYLKDRDKADKDKLESSISTIIIK